jgi:predicted PurR-regulated permease PerM
VNSHHSLRPDISEDARTAALDRIYSLLRLALIGLVACAALWLLADLLTVVFVAALLAVILDGVVGRLMKATRLPHWAALVAVVAGLLAMFAGIVFLAGPGLSDQADKLRLALGVQARDLRDALPRSEWGRLILHQIPTSIWGGALGGNIVVPYAFAGSMAGVLGSTIGAIASLAVVLIAALYMAATPGLYFDGVLRVVPARRRNQARTVLLVAGAALRAWSAGQVLAMILLGVLWGLGLRALGVPLAFVLGVLAGVTNFVPYLGAVVGALPAVVLAFSVNPTMGLETIVLFAVIQCIEGNLIEPLIQQRAVHVPPALTILSQTACGMLLGIPGIIFATPITAALLAVARQVSTHTEDDGPSVDQNIRIGR